MSDHNGEGFATKAIHAGQDPHQWSHRAVVAPLVMSTTFQQDGPDEHHGYIYGRTGNPTRQVLETCLAALENGKYAVTYASGLGATTAAVGLLKAGDHIICGDDVYGGTNRHFSDCCQKMGMDATFVDTVEVDNVMKAIRPNTKMIWFESPTNPMLKVSDIKAIVATVKAKRPDIIIVIDNTFVTCYFQKPLDLGIDCVMYSLSKYMNGHNDVIMGAVITNRDDLGEQLRFIQKAMGIVPSPFDCYQVNRGLKTLEIRMEKHMANGLAIAKYLEAHPLVGKVFHPLLPSHPQHEIAKKQQSGHSGMVAFYVKGDSAEFLRALRFFMVGGSLGGPQSLIELPAVMSHAQMKQEDRDAVGMTDKLIRMSCGLEDPRDLIADLEQALKASQL